MLALDVADGRVPVIHDVHDMQSLRSTPYEDGFDDPEDQDVLEREAVEGCAGLIAVSEEMREELEARYTLPPHTLLFANYALSRDIAQSAAPRPGRGRTAAGGLPGEPVGQREPLRPARPLPRPSERPGCGWTSIPNRDAPAYRELARTVAGDAADATRWRRSI